MSVIKKLIIAAVLCCVFASLSAMEVKVVEVTGKVEVQSGNKWVAVSKGDILSAGAVISTGFKSEAVLSFAETVIKVKALTRLTIEQLFEKDGDKASSVYLDTGSISADVKPAENKRVGFSVKTPAATASVRGTSGDVYSDGTIVGTSGKWCITPPEEKLIIRDSVPASNDTQEGNEQPAASEGTSETTDNIGDTTEPPATTAENPAEPAPETPEVTQDTSVAQTSEAWTDFDFTYPDPLGAVYVSAGETSTVSGGSLITPFDNKVFEATNSSGVQTLSDTEKVAPTGIQVIPEVATPASAANTNIVVPEKPRYGTVEVTVTLTLPQSN